MRATMGMNYRLLSANLETMSNKLFELRQQAATGKKLNRPSDNPSAIRPVLNYRIQHQSTDRYLNHLSSAEGEIRILDSHLGNIENIMVAAKETAIAAANSGANEADRQTYADKIHQLYEELLYAGNTQVNGKYLFSGYREDTAPFNEQTFSVEEAASYIPLANEVVVEKTEPGDVDHPTVYTLSFSNMAEDYVAGGKLRVVIGEHAIETDMIEDDIDGSINRLIDAINEATAPTSGHPLEGVLGETPRVEDSDGSFTLSAAINEEDSFEVYDAVMLELSDATFAQIESGAGGGFTGYAVSFSTEAEDYFEGGILEVVINGHLIEVYMADENVDESINELIKAINNATAPNSGHPLEGVLAKIDDVENFDGTLFLTAANRVGYQGDNNIKTVEIEPGKSIDKQLSGSVLFLGEPDGENLFSVLKNLEETIRGGNIQAINERLDQLEDSAEQVRRARGRMGNNAWRIDRASTYLSDAAIEFESMISRYEDADALDVFSRILAQEFAFEAALNVTTRVSRMSILDFM